MFGIINYLIEAIGSIAILLRFVFPWLLVALCGWTIVSAIIDAINRAKQMHSIPCTNCRFFTNDYRLKCTIHPHIANTEGAIDCSDYRPN
ncbi:hypothetical protein IQ238_16080 [Pleurocapsales cyanobacterium LEGE 06147]|nr:hypothetical protein [Pleurocapsales cyanobacterium LEGE 06147]